MKHYMVAIKDSALQAFTRPFAAPTLQTAIRSFQDEVNRGDSELAKHPEDYEMYKLGEWDDESGAFVNDVALIARGAEVRRVQE